MDEKERQDFDLEDILKEFGDEPQPEEKTVAPEEESEYLREELPWKMPVHKETEATEDTVTIDLATVQKVVAQESKADEKRDQPQCKNRLNFSEKMKQFCQENRVFFTSFFASFKQRFFFKMFR